MHLRMVEKGHTFVVFLSFPLLLSPIHLFIGALPFVSLSDVEKNREEAK